ncbi:MAG: biotin-independent malonate decarboxylase subunit gamma [Lentisphaeria bacterium]
MTAQETLDKIFPAGYQLSCQDTIFSGTGSTTSGQVAIIGSEEHPVLGIQEILQLSKLLLQVLRNAPGQPILLLVDNNGQKMALEDELLGLNQYLAHLVKLQDLARRRGHPVIALVYGNSCAGGFIGFGLCAGQTYALPDSNTSVMILPAIARITKLPLEYLEELSKTVAVFAPGVQNFERTGGVESVWRGDLNQCLELALQKSQLQDQRAELGAQRGGRPLSAQVINKVLNA